MSLTRPVSSIAVVLALVVSTLLSTDSVVVDPGDTLSEIAASNGVTVAQLMEWNGITEPDLIYAGTELIIVEPTGAKTTTGGTQAPAQSYVVQLGDTLSAVAHRFSTTILRVAELNRISNPNLIYVGQTLTLGDAVHMLPTTPAPQTYTVRFGDTLSGIASRFGVTATSLAAANSISNPNRITEGRTLTIPVAPSNTAPDTATAPTATPTVATTPPTTTTPPANTTTPPTTTPPTTTAPAPTTTIEQPTTELPSPAAPAGTTTTTTTAAPPGTVPDPSVIGSASLSPLFEHWAAIYSVPQGLLEALAWKESNWRPDAVGPAGHLGIAQLSPETVSFVEANLLGAKTDPLDPSDGIRLEARYLRYLTDRTNGERQALEAWNQGLHDLLANGASVSGSRFADDVLAIRDARA